MLVQRVQVTIRPISLPEDIRHLQAMMPERFRHRIHAATAASSMRSAAAQQRVRAGLIEHSLESSLTEQHVRRMQRDGGIFLVAVDEYGAIVGFVAGVPESEGRLAVDHVSLSNIVGRRLLAAIEVHARSHMFKKVVLSAVSQQQDCESFYALAGYTLNDQAPKPGPAEEQKTVSYEKALWSVNDEMGDWLGEDGDWLDEEGEAREATKKRKRSDALAVC